jgi:hypothetical protein
LEADFNAAGTILKRSYDTEISRWTHYKKVKSILEDRTQRRRNSAPPRLQLKKETSINGERKENKYLRRDHS